MENKREIGILFAQIWKEKKAKILNTLSGDRIRRKRKSENKMLNQTSFQ